jgi:autophagy-related protein 2
MVQSGNINIFLYDGYDWLKTRRSIEEQVKEMRKRLAKIRQLAATGQVPDSSVEETSALLFNSVYIGLDQDMEDLEPGALILAIDEELREDEEIASQSSWQTLKSPSGAQHRQRSNSTRVHGKRLTRSKGPTIELCVSDAELEVDQYLPGEMIASRTFVTVKNFEILDHVSTSTWRKFLTNLHHDSRGNVRETDSNMVKVELVTVRPVVGDSSEEARLKVSGRCAISMHSLTIYGRPRYYR